MSIDPDAPGTAAVFCRLVGISRQRLTGLRQEGIVRGETLGQWLRAYVEALRATASGRAPQGHAEEKLAWLAARRRLAELRVAVAEGRVIDADLSKRAHQTLIHNAKAKFLGMPSRLAAELAAEPDPARCFKLLQDTIHEALHELADGKGA